LFGLTRKALLQRQVGGKQLRSKRPQARLSLCLENDVQATVKTDCPAQTVMMKSASQKTMPVQLQRHGERLGCWDARRNERFTPTTPVCRSSCRRSEDHFVRDWPNRDPIGEFGGLNLYTFVNNDPIIWIDRLGLTAVGTPVPIPPGNRSIVCRGGKLVVQNPNNGPDSKCSQVHEESHLKDWKDRYGDDLCKGVKDGYLPVGGDDYAEFLRQSECKAYKAGKKCREDLLKGCDPKDKAAIQAGIDRDNAQLKKNKCD
jgi:hypothetical protein